MDVITCPCCDQNWPMLIKGTQIERGNILRLVAPVLTFHDDVIKWKHFPRYWPFVRGIHRSPLNFAHKGRWRGALMFHLICALNKRLNKQSWGWWFETPTRSLWRHCNVLMLWWWHISLRMKAVKFNCYILWHRLLHASTNATYILSVQHTAGSDTTLAGRCLQR